GNSASGVLTCGCGAFGGFAGVTITNSTISDNSSGDSGGGIHLRGITYLSIANNTISGNSAGTSGGGIYAPGCAANVPDRVSIVTSTISGNSAGTSGGGIYDAVSVLHVANSTISGNSAGSGGGIYNGGGADGGINGDISDTILNAGASGENIFNSGGTFTSHG